MKWTDYTCRKFGRYLGWCLLRGDNSDGREGREQNGGAHSESNEER